MLPSISTLHWTKETFMKLTTHEQEVILKMREKQDKNTPKFSATLKHDIFYLINTRNEDIILDVGEVIQKYGWYIPQSAILEIKELLNQELNSCLKLEKGAKFDGYIDDGETLWYDSEGFGVEEASAQWASDNLKNITKLK